MIPTYLFFEARVAKGPCTYIVGTWAYQQLQDMRCNAMQCNANVVQRLAMQRRVMYCEVLHGIVMLMRLLVISCYMSIIVMLCNKKTIHTDT